MEPRSAHYHSGLDIRTEGRIGVPVFAPAAGSVRRVRVSPHGYGQALYLEIADGRTLVFAHLDRLSDPLQRRVIEAQRRTRRYTQDLYLEPGEVEVVTGELLGLSGATGTGAPHLHFEVRDVAERPVNPLLAGVAVPDHEAPVIRRFRLVPQTEASRAAGRARPREVVPGGTTSASGLLAVDVEVDDTTGVAPHRVMPLGVELRVDGRVVYRLQQESFGFAQGRQMRLEVVEDSVDPRRRWLRLHRVAGNDLPGREGPGQFEAKGTHEVSVRAWDAAGNESSASFSIGPVAATIEVGPGFEVTGTLLAVAGAPGSRSTVSAAGLGELELSLDAAGEGAIALDRLASGPVRLRDAAGTREILLLRGGEAVVNLGLHPAGVIAQDPTGQALFPGGAVWIESADAPADLPPTTRAAGPAWQLHGAGVAFRNDLDLHLPVDTRDQVVVLRRDPRGRWSTLESKPLEGQRISAAVDGLGLLVPVSDRTPPHLGPFRCRGLDLAEDTRVERRASRDRAGTTAAVWHSVALTLEDPGVGLGDDGPRCQVDGVDYPARWDPEENRVVFEWDVEPEPGPHRLTVTATDLAGNTASRSIRIVLP